ncbi:MAG: copper-binding protein [Aeromonas sp.]
MNYKKLTQVLLLSIVAIEAHAEMAMHHEGHDMSQMNGMQMHAANAPVMTKGVITRLDEANGKVGIKHEAIANLKMPPMTMVFTLTQPAQLKGLKVGDAVNFHATSEGGKLTVTQLQPQ